MLTRRFEEALIYATRLHAHQKRKGRGVPYIAHLLAVASLIIEGGGDEDLAIAALLHDAVEDQGGLITLREIERRFGKRVAHIVEDCSDANVLPKPAWKPRKEAHLARLRNADRDVLQVALADKLHNARSLLEDLRKDGTASLERFRGGQEGTLWYYQSAVKLFQEAHPGAWADELARIVAEIDILIRA